MLEQELADEQNQPLLENNQRRRKLQVGILTAFILIVFLLGGLIFLVSSPDPERTVLLISLDGFRYEYLERGFTSNLLHMMKNGVHAKMIPSFPSSTFPNHYTLVTGLHPEKHGIIDNHFFDPEFNETFDYKSESSLQKKWWKGESIWQTVEKANYSSFVYMYPGCNVDHDIKPKKYVPYDDAVKFDQKIDVILKELENNRPKFMAIYTPEVDQIGHRSGPDSADVNTILSIIDDGFRRLLDGIRELSLQDFVDVVVVSDHGMMNVRPDAWIDYQKWMPEISQKMKISDEGVVWGAYPDKHSNNYLFRHR
eukprot:NODE_88_length_21789_cov_0.534440.p6 type:complete len:310 gc:universal NODE_88_length_21789_cov_0.534440:18789-19718(+)